MADGVQVDDTGIRVNDTGVVVGAAGDACCCGSDKFCYYLWQWDCPSQTRSLVDTQCLSSPPEEGTENWFWNGTYWQIWMTGAACTGAGDCDSPVTPFPASPDDTTHPCPHWTYPRDCAGSLASFAMTSADAVTFGSEVWRYGDTCYTFVGGVGTFIEPGTVISAGDVTVVADCDHCTEPDPDPCADDPDCPCPDSVTVELPASYDTTPCGGSLLGTCGSTATIPVTDCQGTVSDPGCDVQFVSYAVGTDDTGCPAQFIIVVYNDDTAVAYRRRCGESGSPRIYGDYFFYEGIATLVGGSVAYPRNDSVSGVCSPGSLEAGFSPSITVSP